MEGIDTTKRTIIEKIWHRLRLYMFNGWDNLRLKIEASRIDRAKARALFIAKFGNDRLAYHFEGEKIMVALSPPRPL